MAPEGYLKIRDAYIKKGFSRLAAEGEAAKIWNAKHKGKESVGRGRK